MNRRQMLRSIAVAAGAAASGLSWRAAETGAFSESEGAAYRPWRQEPGQPGLHSAVRAATLAASPHNTQPWLFRVSKHQIELFADASRNLGTIDPLLREQHIGTGSALENLLLAAQNAGFGVSRLAYDDQTGSQLIASVGIYSCAPREPMLSKAIAHRHTNRGLYQANRVIPANLIDEMSRLNTEAGAIRVRFWTESSGRIRDLMIAAAEAVVADREQSRDSAKWFRGSRAEIELHRDGTTIEAQGFSPLMTVFAKMLPEPSDSFADQVFLANTRRVYCGPGVLFGTIVVKEPGSKCVRVRVGRLWQRMHLWATTQGIAMQPLNQIHERIDREATSLTPARFTNELRSLIEDAGWQGIFSFRMGYPTRHAKPSPRRDVTQCLI
jgi:hypothetical protein